MPQWVKDAIVSLVMIAIAALAFLGLFSLGFMVKKALAHDSWINQGGWEDPVSKDSCCGTNDCERVAGDMVSRTPAGYYLKQTGETIPMSRALPSQDGQFWRCRYLTGLNTGKTRCFFTVEPGF